MPRKPDPSTVPEPPAITPAVEALIDTTLEAILDGQLTAETPTDVYVGKTPAELDERDAARDAAHAVARDQSSSATERRIQLLEDQLRENQALIQKLAKDRGGYTTVGPEVAALAQEEARRKVYKRITENGGFCTISVHTHEDAAQNFPVDVGVNGRQYRLPRGQQIVVPVAVIEVLDHARIDSWVREVDAQGNPQLVRHERMSYPYSLLDYSGQRLEQLVHAA